MEFTSHLTVLIIPWLIAALGRRKFDNEVARESCLIEQVEANALPWMYYL